MAVPVAMHRLALLALVCCMALAGCGTPVPPGDATSPPIPPPHEGSECAAFGCVASAMDDYAGLFQGSGLKPLVILQNYDGADGLQVEGNLVVWHSLGPQGRSELGAAAYDSITNSIFAIGPVDTGGLSQFSDAALDQGFLVAPGFGAHRATNFSAPATTLGVLLTWDVRTLESLATIVPPHLDPPESFVGPAPVAPGLVAYGKPALYSDQPDQRLPRTAYVYDVRANTTFSTTRGLPVALTTEVAYLFVAGETGENEIVPWSFRTNQFGSALAMGNDTTPTVLPLGDGLVVQLQDGSFAGLEGTTVHAALAPLGGGRLVGHADHELLVVRAAPGCTDCVELHAANPWTSADRLLVGNQAGGPRITAICSAALDGSHVVVAARIAPADSAPGHSGPGCICNIG